MLSPSQYQREHVSVLAVASQTQLRVYNAELHPQFRRWFKKPLIGRYIAGCIVSPRVNYTRLSLTSHGGLVERIGQIYLRQPSAGPQHGDFRAPLTAAESKV